MIASTVGVFLLGALIGAAVVWLALLGERRAMSASVETLIERAKNELSDSTAARAGERVGELVAPVAQQLHEFDRLVQELEARRARDAGSLHAQIEQLLGRAEKLEGATAGLTTQTSTLVAALRHPASRGKWGEMQLRNVVEKAGMLPYCDFSEQQTVALEEGRGRPDMTVNLPGDRVVFVDAKAPTDAMQAALEAVDDESRRALVRRHAKALRDHVDALARRGYRAAAGSADYVVMFVPGEAFLSAAFSDDPALIEYAVDKGILIAGPLALIALLRTFATGWQAVRQEENARRIAEIGTVLYERCLKFSTHLLEVRRHLERSVNAFNGAVGSYESKLLPQGRRLKEEASLVSDDLTELPPIDVLPRSVAALDTETPAGRRPRSQRLFPDERAG